MLTTCGSLPLLFLLRTSVTSDAPSQKVEEDSPDSGRSGGIDMDMDMDSGDVAPPAIAVVPVVAVDSIEADIRSAGDAAVAAAAVAAAAAAAPFAVAP